MAPKLISWYRRFPRTRPLSRPEVGRSEKHRRQHQSEKVTASSNVRQDAAATRAVNICHEPIQASAERDRTSGGSRKACPSGCQHRWHLARRRRHHVPSHAARQHIYLHRLLAVRHIGRRRDHKRTGIRKLLQDGVCERSSDARTLHRSNRCRRKHDQEQLPRLGLWGDDQRSQPIASREDKTTDGGAICPPPRQTGRWPAGPPRTSPPGRDTLPLPPSNRF